MRRVLSILHEAVASLAAHRLRSALTALSVTFGTAVLFILLGYGTGVPGATSEMLHRLGSTEFTVEPERTSGPGGGGRGGRRIRVRYADLPAVRDACPSIDGIAAVYRPSRGRACYTANAAWPYASLNGVSSSYAEVTDLAIRSGRWFSPEEEAGAMEVALLNLPLVEGLFEGRSPIGEFVDFETRRFDIIGVYESDATFSYGLLVPYTTAMAMGDGGRHVSELAFRPLRPELAAEAISEIRQALGAIYSFDPDDPRALDIDENIGFITKVREVAAGLEWMVLTIAGLALVLGCLGAANVVGIAVSERTAELGLRKALGATAGRLRAEVLTETLVLCVGGGVLGVALGALTTLGLGPLRLSEHSLLQPRVDMELLLASLVVLVLVATLAGLPAAQRAARLDPITALREE